MKKMLSVVLILSILMTSCADSLTYENGQGQKVTVTSTGVFNKGDRDPNVNYELCVGNVVWSIILVETFFAPVYFVGWSIMEPVSVRQQVIIVRPETTSEINAKEVRKDSLRRQASAEQAKVGEKIEAHLDAASNAFFGSNEPEPDTE